MRPTRRPAWLTDPLTPGKKGLLVNSRCNKQSRKRNHKRHARRAARAARAGTVR